MSKSSLKEAWRNAPLITLTITVSIALEAFGWGYIWGTNTETVAILGRDIPMALIESTIISATGLMALIAAFVSAERQNDPRPEQRRMATAAQFLAIALIVPPVFKAADAFAFPAQVDAAGAFRASEAYAESLSQSRDNTMDSMVRAQARAELNRGVAPTRAQFDGTWIVCLLGAAFLYGVNMLAARLLWRAKPETAGERERRLADEIRAQRRSERRRRDMLELARIQAETANARPGWFRGIFSSARRA